jgi:hypothetical protein
MVARRPVARFDPPTWGDAREHKILPTSWHCWSCCAHCGGLAEWLRGKEEDPERVDGGSVYGGGVYSGSSLYGGRGSA